MSVDRIVVNRGVEHGSASVGDPMVIGVLVSAIKDLDTMTPTIAEELQRAPVPAE